MTCINPFPKSNNADNKMLASFEIKYIRIHVYSIHPYKVDYFKMKSYHTTSDLFIKMNSFFCYRS